MSTNTFRMILGGTEVQVDGHVEDADSTVGIGARFYPDSITVLDDGTELDPAELPDQDLDAIDSRFWEAIAADESWEDYPEDESYGGTSDE